MADTAKKRTKIQIEKDRTEIAKLYLQGQPQHAIGEKLGVSQQQISYDLKIIRERWVESANSDIDEKISKELAKIDNLEETYWSAWQRSLTAKENEEEQPGDPRFLAGVERCIERRCKLCGLDAASKTDITSGGKPLDDTINRALSRIYGQLEESDE